MIDALVAQLSERNFIGDPQAILRGDVRKGSESRHPRRRKADRLTLAGTVPVP